MLWGANKLIIVYVAGGLGNQLFHYAFAKAYSLKKQCDVFLDIEIFRTRKINNDLSTAAPHMYYCLKLYKTSLRIANDSQINKLKSMTTRINKLPIVINKLLNIPEKTKSHFIFYKPHGIYNPNMFDLNGDLYIRGDFQSEKYFKDYRKEILSDLTLDIKLNDENIKVLKQIKSTNSVSIHIRRGDYLKYNSVVLPIEYYEKAIEYLLSKHKDLHFYIFSNDTKWVLDNIKIDAPFTVIDINPPNKGYYDLELMRNCKHNIIANSSFSWWGAWLNKNPEKIVIAPYPWFGKNDSMGDTIPDTWIKIER